MSSNPTKLKNKSRAPERSECRENFILKKVNSCFNITHLIYEDISILLFLYMGSTPRCSNRASRSNHIITGSSLVFLDFTSSSFMTEQLDSSRNFLMRITEKIYLSEKTRTALANWKHKFQINQF